MAEFQWVPLLDASADNSLRVSEVRFGDGYSQRLRDGINTHEKTWSLRFVDRVAVISAIEAFIVSRGGADSFTFSPPGGGADVRVVCKRWRRVEKSAFLAELSADFEKVPA